VNDYFQFVTGFFEVISTSPSHIYHSALPLSPKTSIVRRLYELDAHPFMRVVQGEPVSWDPALSTTLRYSDPVLGLSWSPCSRFIAAASYSTGIQILDAVTFKQLKTFIYPQDFTQLLAFSPESHLMTWLGVKSEVFTTWDFLTGVLVSEIPRGEGSVGEAHSMVYSKCGTKFGVLFKGDSNTIGTYNFLSSTPICYHPIKGPVIGTIWTYGECLRFTTLGPKSIVVWEAGFTARLPPMEVESLSIPNNFDPSAKFLFLPSLSCFAFILETTVLVWDAHHSKLLLNSMSTKRPIYMTFSPDGHFFAYGTDVGEIHLWEESPTGYILLQKLTPGSGGPFVPCELLLSPNGKSIVVSAGRTLHLWHTTDSATSPSSLPTQVIKRAKKFILEFSPDRSLAAATQLETKMVTVINLKSSVPQLIIDTDMRVYGLKVVGDTIIVAGSEKIVTWKLPKGSGVLSARANINDSIQTTMLKHPSPHNLLQTHTASISPNFKHIAVTGEAKGVTAILNIYDVPTGGHLISTHLCGLDTLWFTPDGHEVWSSYPEGWGIIKNSKSNITKLKCLDLAQGPSGGFPWQSSLGNQVTNDGWILDSSGRQLLWLPHHWRVRESHRVWEREILAFLSYDLLDIVILEVLKE